MLFTIRKMQKTRRQSPANFSINYSEDERNCKLVSTHAKIIEFTVAHKYLVKDHNGTQHTIDYLNRHGYDIYGTLVEQKTAARKELHFFAEDTPGIV